MLTFHVLYTLSLLARFTDHLDRLTGQWTELKSIRQLKLHQTLDAFSLLVRVMDIEMLRDGFSGGQEFLTFVAVGVRRRMTRL